MAMTKVGQMLARFRILSALLLGGALFTGCQTSKPDSGFSEVPGMSETAPATVTPASQTTVPVPVATTNPGTPTSTNTDLSAEIIHPGNVLIVTFADLPPGQPMPPTTQLVRDDGTITLIYNQPFHAAGKRVGDLEQEIRNFYVPAYFRNLTVTVVISFETRFFYVEGEVKSGGGKFPYVPGTTVSKAIATAGGFTDFANKRKAKLIRRDGRTQTINFNKVLDHPELDPQLYPDDRIHVPRRLLW